MSGEFRIKTMCKVLKVSRSGYYDWLGRHESRVHKESAMKELKYEVKKIFVKSRGTYGYRSIKKELANNGIYVSRNAIVKAMKNNDLRAIPIRSKPYPKPNETPEHKVCKNRLRRKFSVTKANRYWVGDITYLWTTEGWLYLATVIDLFSRKVVGWSISNRADTKLAVNALKNALANRPYRRWRLMFHSDQGCQYTSNEMQKFLRDRGVLQSMSRRGQCWDNAVVESFFGSLKQETGIGKNFISSASETKYIIFDWVECWYNTQRRHSKLGYNSPSSFESTQEAA